MAAPKFDGTATVPVRMTVYGSNGTTPISNTNPVEIPVSQLMSGSPASAGSAGTVKRGVAVPNAAAAPTQAEFNALLASLRAAGVIAT